MGVIVLTPGYTTEDGHWSGPTRPMAWALAELALRGGFAQALNAFGSLDRLRDTPETEVVWILADPVQVREALSGGTSPHRRGPALFVTPRHEFWDRPTETVPEPVDPRGKIPIQEGPFGHRTWFEPVDWLAVFWSLLQRAEEYSPSAPVDSHGRFPAWASSLVRQNLIDRPVADEIARHMGRRFRALQGEGKRGAKATGAEPNPSTEENAPTTRKLSVASWTLAVTHDVDSVRFWSWRRLGRRVFRQNPEETVVTHTTIGPEAAEPFIANVPRLFRRLVHAQWFRTVRSEVYPQRDPHWSFPWLRQWETGRKVRPTLFVIPERRTLFEPYDLSKGDGNRGFSRRLLVQLRRWAEDGAEIGLHPPYDAMEHPDRLGEQRLRLESLIAGGAIQSARFHWLRFRPPSGWNELAKAGLVNDATLGHAQRVGFRAATCHPFVPVDLRTGAETGVTEIPLVAMDTTMRYHQAMTPGQAFARLYQLMRACRACGGVFTLLWHTNSFDRWEWKGWRRVFVRIVDEAMEQGAASKTISEIANEHRAAREEILQRIAPDT